MTWVDLVVLLILTASALLAFLRGFVRETLGLCAWAAALYVAATMYSQAVPEAHRLIGASEIAEPAAFAVVFLIALIVFSVIAGLVARSVRGSSLGGLDRTVGVAFGLLRGAAIVSAVYIVVGLVIAVRQWPDVVLQSRSLPYAYVGARWIANRFPPFFAPKVDPPPAWAADRGAMSQPPLLGDTRPGAAQEDR